MDANLCEMKVEDYDEVAAIWRAAEGIGLHDDVDSREGIAAYLARNPGTSQVARHAGRIIGDRLVRSRRTPWLPPPFGGCRHLARQGRWPGFGGNLLGEACRHWHPEVQHISLRRQRTWGSILERTGWNERADLKVLQRPCSFGEGP